MIKRYKDLTRSGARVHFNWNTIRQTNRQTNKTDGEKRTNKQTNTKQISRIIMHMEISIYWIIDWYRTLCNLLCNNSLNLTGKIRVIRGSLLVLSYGWSCRTLYKKNKKVVSEKIVESKKPIKNMPKKTSYLCNYHMVHFGIPLKLLCNWTLLVSFGF